MSDAQTQAWLDDLLKRGESVPLFNDFYREQVAALAWLGEAESAMASVFPIGHPIRVMWQRVVDRASTYSFGTGAMKTQISALYAGEHFNQLLGVVKAGGEVVRSGRLRGLLDGVRAETVSEVLDQAQGLLTAHHTVAATVLAGGALETHLRHLCVRNNLSWPGEGSIAKYDAAVAQARNAGIATVYSATDSRLIGGWGGMRNDAAHDPVAYRRGEEDVRRMIEGILEFVARVP
jgi:hypothetical protein